MRVVSLTQMLVPKYLFTPSSRDAVFTVSPSAVYCILLWAPKLPTIAGPVWTPTRVLPSLMPFSRCLARNSSE